jgi:hypothetical protein
LRTIDRRYNRKPSLIVGNVATCSSCLSMTRISVGESERSRGDEVCD